MFEELGFEVVSSVGFSCANALHIAHVPDWAKEKAILELLGNDENKLDAVVQCGTNMSLIDVTEKLEPVVGIPILGINAVTFLVRATGERVRRGFGRCREIAARVLTGLPKATGVKDETAAMGCLSTSKLLTSN
jgi:maleate cis-trans isomerase